MRQIRHSGETECPAGALSASPQRAHTGSLGTGKSVQQTSQIGTGESSGRGEPQRAQEAGRREQLTASMGLRSTRTTARHRVVGDDGTSLVPLPEFLWKTHLARQAHEPATLCAKYTASPSQASTALLPQREFNI